MKKIRLLIQALSFAFSNGYVKGFTAGKIYKGELKNFCHPGLNCYSCPGALFSCPIGALQTVSPTSLYVFGFLFLVGTIFGRAVCGWLCPFGLVQRLLYMIPVKNKRKNLKGHEKLKYLKYFVLVISVLWLRSFCTYLCPSGMLFGAIPLTIISKPIRELIGSTFFIKLSILALFIVLSIYYARPFCKYICPLGAIYSLFNPISIIKLRVDEAKCTKCSSCQRACPMDIAVYKNPRSLECIRCGDCISSCPHKAIDIISSL